MSRFPILAALLLSLSLALAPAVAEARAGSSMSRGPVGMSQGSAGSRTYAPSIGAPVQRSITPTTPTAPAYRPTAPVSPGFGGGLFGGGFMSGLFGGLIGAGIGHMLFGGGYGYGGGLGAGGVIGSLFHLLLWGLIIWFAFRLFRRMFGGGPAFNTASNRDGGYGGYSGYAPSLGGGYGAAAPVDSGSTIPITDEDYNAFSRLLVDIQNAWSRGDINALRRYMTPEMQSYFSEELSRNASDGVENRVEDVQFQNGALQQAWSEADIDYAQALMGWNAKDYYVRNDRHPGDRDYVAKGDPERPVPAQELWTFMRRHGGNWLLSAIQQV